MAHFLRLIDHLGGVQQGLGRNAADIEADAAERRVTFHQHGLESQVRGPERAAVAARSRADDEHLALDVHCAAVSVGGRRRGRCLGWRRAGTRWRFGCRLERQDKMAFAHLVADFHANRLDHATGRRRHVHRRLVRLQRDQRILGLDRIAALDQHLDDRHVGEIADVRNLDLDRTHRYLAGTGANRTMTLRIAS